MVIDVFGGDDSMDDDALSAGDADAALPSPAETSDVSGSLETPHLNPLDGLEPGVEGMLNDVPPLDPLADNPLGAYSHAEEYGGTVGVTAAPVIVNGLDEADGPYIGTNDTDAWQYQQTGFTCGVASVRGVVESLTGENVSEAELVYDATSFGLLNRSGMNFFDIADLLAIRGIPCHVVENGTIEDLVGHLQDGEKVIVGVDSGELDGTDSPFEDFIHQTADHALTVTGFSYDGDGNPVVVTNDTGIADGAGKEYPLDEFIDAWEDSRCTFVVTDVHAPVGDNLDETSALETADGVGSAEDILRRHEFLKNI